MLFRTDIARYALQRISAYDDIINSVSFINPDLITESAAMDQMLQEYKAAGTPLPYLFCVPILFKVSLTKLANGRTYDFTVHQGLRTKGVSILFRESIRRGSHGLWINMALVYSNYGGFTLASRNA